MQPLPRSAQPQTRHSLPDRTVRRPETPESVARVLAEVPSQGAGPKRRYWDEGKSHGPLTTSKLIVPSSPSSLSSAATASILPADPTRLLAPLPVVICCLCGLIGSHYSWCPTLNRSAASAKPPGMPLAPPAATTPDTSLASPSASHSGPPREEISRRAARHFASASQQIRRGVSTCASWTAGRSHACASWISARARSLASRLWGWE